SCRGAGGMPSPSARRVIPGGCCRREKSSGKFSAPGRKFLALVLRASLDTRLVAHPEQAVVERLRELGVQRGILMRLARDRQIIEVRCEMPQCYCFRGRSYFKPRMEGSDWELTADHYPMLKMHGGKLSPD